MTKKKEGKEKEIPRLIGEIEGHCDNIEIDIKVQPDAKVIQREINEIKKLTEQIFQAYEGMK